MPHRAGANNHGKNGAFTFRVMAFAQLTHRESLRDIEEEEAVRKTLRRGNRTVADMARELNMRPIPILAIQNYPSGNCKSLYPAYLAH